MKLDQVLNIKAWKRPDKCVEVTWDKVESGACFVKFELKFKNATGNFLYNETGYNIMKMEKCNLADFVNLTEIQLTVSFKNTSKSYTFIIPKPTTTPSTRKPG